MINRTTEVVSVKGDTNQYSKSIGKARKKNQGFSRSIQKTNSGLTGMTNKIANNIGKIAAMGGAMYGIGAIVNKTATAWGDFGTLLKRAGVNGHVAMLSLEESTAGLISRIDLLKAQTVLMGDEFKLTTEQMQGVLKAAIEYSRKTGTDITQAVKLMQDTVTTGRQSNLRKLGIDADITGSQTEKTAKIVEMLTNKYKDLDITTEDAGERQTVLRNKMQATNIEVGRQTEKLKDLALKGLDLAIDGYIKLAQVATGDYRSEEEKRQDAILTGLKNQGSLMKQQAILLSRRLTLTEETYSLERKLRKRETAQQALLSIGKKLEDSEKNVVDLKKRKLRIEEALQLANDRYNRKLRMGEKVLQSDIELIAKIAKLRSQVSNTIKYEIRMQKKLNKYHVDWNDIFGNIYQKSRKIAENALSLFNIFSQNTDKTKKITKKSAKSTEDAWRKTLRKTFQLYKEGLISRNELLERYETDNYRKAIGIERRKQTEKYKLLQKYQKKREQQQQVILEREEKLLSQSLERRKATIQQAGENTIQYYKQAFGGQSMIEQLEAVKSKRSQLTEQQKEQLRQAIDRRNAYMKRYLSEKDPELRDRWKALYQQAQQDELALYKQGVAQQEQLDRAAKSKELERAKKHQEQLKNVRKQRIAFIKQSGQEMIKATVTPMVKALGMTNSQLEEQGKSVSQMVKESLKAIVWKITNESALKAALALAEGVYYSFTNPALAATKYSAAAMYGSIAGGGVAITKMTGGVPGMSGSGGSTATNSEQNRSQTAPASTTQERGPTIVNINVPHGQIVDSTNLARIVKESTEDALERGRL